MRNIINSFKEAFLNIGVADVILIALFTLSLYYILDFLRRNNAIKLAASFLVIIFAVGLISIAERKITNDFFIFLIFVLVAMILSVFSAEFKRDIWDTKKKRPQMPIVANADSIEIDRYISEIIKALQNMSKGDTGAIVILCKGTVPPQILESGVVLQSEISSQIIESVFFPKSPLHDGAMLINGSKILAAGCFLPLSQEVNLPKELGTRHRAGIGITEALNVTSLIVSEETGIISIAQSGKLVRYADYNMLKEKLTEYYYNINPIDKKRR